MGHNHAHEHSGHIDEHIDNCRYLETKDPADCRCGDEVKHYLVLAALSAAAAIIQIATWGYTRSLAAGTDGSHAGSDLVENLFSAYIAKEARRTEDENRLRLWGGRVSSLLILFVSYFIMQEALERLRTPELIIADVAFFGVLVGGLINLCQIILHRRAHKEHRNTTHYLQDLHLAFDFMSSVAAVVGVCFVLFGGYLIADTIAAFIIVGLIWFRVIRWLVYGIPKED